MPSPVAHLSVGAALWFFWRKHRPAPAGETRAQFLLQGTGFLAASMLPDLDAVPGILFGDMHRFHNQQSHSLLAGLAVSLLAALIAGKLRQQRFSNEVFAITLVSYTLHVLMDALTLGRGVLLFWPFSAERLKPPFILFRGLRWTEGLWHSGHLLTFAEEAVFGLLLLGIILLSSAFTRFQRQAFRPEQISSNPESLEPRSQVGTEAASRRQHKRGTPK